MQLVNFNLLISTLYCVIMLNAVIHNSTTPNGGVTPLSIMTLNITLLKLLCSVPHTFIVTLSVVKLGVFMLSVIMLSVIMLSVVAFFRTDPDILLFSLPFPQKFVKCKIIFILHKTSYDYLTITLKSRCTFVRQPVK